ncbi:MAG TPA: hypothetical protein QF517_08835 [Pseudomonadales bacterium]|jgi:hypothetical protein|nr:hypothetical protein [Gammaproteobacteria bacterium]MDP7316554.1 hypothetical protein [Pseudomonadales bacterium]HJL62049.1 hypothetical protein [Pseudomonadales bacterium]HJP52306.1 hypothetical protein [Pseudomonadales bacterium]|tara:strand:- start:5478 stop:6539 length:1062 start_codon:yes stop_codon:yes gene_type:complete
MGEPQPVITIELNQQLTPITLRAPLRMLKGKRLVFEGEASGPSRRLLVKTFSSIRHLAREIDGLDLLSSNDIECPTVIFSGQANDLTGFEKFGFRDHQNIHVLVLEFYPDAENFRTVWHKHITDEYRIHLFTLLFTLIGRQHQAGITQNDLHLGNFLISDDRLISIDGDAIVYNKHLSLESCYEQLGIILSQAYPHFDSMLEKLLPAYFNTRNLPADKQAEKSIFQARAANREVIKRSKIKKSLRNSTDFKVEKTFSRHVFINRNFLTEAFDNDLAQLQTSDLTHEWDRDGNRYRAFYYRWPGFFAKNDARQQWQDAQVLMADGKEIPPPAALVILTFGPFQRGGYYIEVIQS